MDRLCPDCKAELEQVAYHAVSLDTCPACAGIWFDLGELGRVLKDGRVALVEIEENVVPEICPHPTATSRRDCPICLEPLAPYQYLYNSPIELDGCIACNGFWVEDGELIKIQDWLALGGARLKQTTRDRVEDAVAIANYTMEHDAHMRRSENVRALCTLLDRRYPYGRYLGF